MGDRWVLMNIFYFLFPLISLEERGEVNERHVSPRVWKKKIYFLIFPFELS